MIVAIITTIYIIGSLFEKKEGPSDLPPFTKKEAEQYYNDNFK